ncbi:sugar transferase [Sphingomonas sp. SFZ2018-12]|nr:sugar transferase [Sphingomonas sp. SFZ2018-12]
MDVAISATQSANRASGKSTGSESAAGLTSALVRAADVTLAMAALIFLAPLLLLVMLAIYLSDRGPVIFAHRRLGRDGREFGCLKFRSMVTDSQERLRHILETDPVAREEWMRDCKLRNDPRITKVGSFIRKTSIDELPQLWNVIRGEMSIVGPRPIIAAERERYGRYFAHYAAVRPGLTGLWQVSGRNDTTYRRRVACDVVYARRFSFSFNVAIIAKTIPAVVMSRGSY